MNVQLCSINTLKGLYEIYGVEVGQHLYWRIRDFKEHGQVPLRTSVDAYVQMHTPACIA